MFYLRKTKGYIRIGVGEDVYTKGTTSALVHRWLTVSERLMKFALECNNPSPNKVCPAAGRPPPAAATAAEASHHITPLPSSPPCRDGTDVSFLSASCPGEGRLFPLASIEIRPPYGSDLPPGTDTTADAGDKSSSEAGWSQQAVAGSCIVCYDVCAHRLMRPPRAPYCIGRLVVLLQSYSPSVARWTKGMGDRGGGSCIADRQKVVRCRMMRL